MSAKTQKWIRVLVADDQSAIRDALRDLIEIEADMEVVGSAPDGERAIALAEQLQPDAALLDVKCPAAARKRLRT